jgi:branched-chain amino acid transport system permease protein
LIICILFILLTYNIVSSFMGRAFIAVRDNDIAAEVLGVNLTRYKLLAFAISSFYVGVQGGLYALMIGYLEANMFTWMETIGFLVAVIVGGLAMVNGSIMGAAFVILVPHIFSASKELVPMVFGMVIIIILILNPRVWPAEFQDAALLQELAFPLAICANCRQASIGPAGHSEQD